MSSRSVGLFSLAYNKRTTFGFWGSIFYRCLFAADYLPGSVAKKCVDTATSGSYEVVRQFGADVSTPPRKQALVELVPWALLCALLFLPAVQLSVLSSLHSLAGKKRRCRLFYESERMSHVGIYEQTDLVEL